MLNVSKFQLMRVITSHTSDEAQGSFLDNIKARLTGKADAEQLKELFAKFDLIKSNEFGNQSIIDRVISFMAIRESLPAECKELLHLDLTGHLSGSYDITLSVNNTVIYSEQQVVDSIDTPISSTIKLYQLAMQLYDATCGEKRGSAPVLESVFAIAAKLEQVCPTINNYQLMDRNDQEYFTHIFKEMIKNILGPLNKESRQHILTALQEDIGNRVLKITSGPLTDAAKAG